MNNAHVSVQTNKQNITQAEYLLFGFFGLHHAFPLFPVYFYNFGWKDYGVASLTTILDMVKVMSFAMQEGKMAVHCHAGLGRTGQYFISSPKNSHLLTIKFFQICVKVSSWTLLTSILTVKPIHLSPQVS